LTSTVPVVPTYRALTIAGNVLERDEQGEVRHALVADATLPGAVVVVYELR
jgi:hypothetical protein